MKFIVCIKQVPDVASPLQLHDGVIDAGTGRLVLNAYDASAVEAALELSEKHGGSVHLVLVGTSAAQETVRKALAMGAESATLLQLDSPDGLDSLAYAHLLADFLKDQSFDVLLCGKQAQDTDAGLTGSMLAELLGLTLTANAIGLAIDGDELVVTRQGDAGQEIISLLTPCLVTCSNDMNDPRIPSLKGIMGAKRKTIHVRPVDAPEAATRVLRHETIPEREPGRILKGEVDEVVGELVDLLKNADHVLE